MKTVLLVDGNSVFFRSFHAIRDLRRSDGVPTNALYGYVMTLRNLLDEFQPEEMAVAFDCKEDTFRTKQYKDYKANREAPPEELVIQIPYIKQVTELLGIPWFEKPGYEADDLLGTMAVEVTQAGKHAMIVTGDKDMLQLINDNVSIYRTLPTKAHQVYTPAEVKERYGVTPLELIDVFALMGDSVDNIPGVPGIGEKTAIQLIQKYGNLETLYECLDEVSGKKRKENLIQGRENAFLSRKLFIIEKAVPMELEGDSLQISPVDVDTLRGFYSDMEFRSFAAELNEAVTPVDVDAQYETVTSLSELETVVKQVEKAGACAVDTETTSLSSLDARMVGMSISIRSHQGWYIPFAHNEGKNCSLEEARPLLSRVLETESIAKCAHNFKYDIHVFANEGFQVRGVTDDTLIASYLTQPDRQNHKLDTLAEWLLRMKMTPITELIGEGKNQRSMTEVPVETVSDYACEDTDATWQLNLHFETLLKESGTESLYRDVEMPLVSVLNSMERRGIQVDASVLEEQSSALSGEMDGLKGKIFDSVGSEFNLNSPTQLAKILYDDLQLLKGRKRSTRADILEKLAADGVEIARHILEYRQRQKIRSTYLEALHGLIRQDTGRVHSTFNQAVVNTGRISSTEPNLQNIPIRTDLGRRVRQAFVARPGYQLLSLDYSQIELRVLAHMSNDPGLTRAFSAGEDIHRRTAAEVFGVSMDDVNADMRRKAKEINFGLNYGMSPYGLARRLGIAEKEASTYIETYFSRYPLVQQYVDETVATAQEHLHVTTLLGRRVPTPGVRDTNRMRQDNAKRAAINAPIQGSAADLLKKAMVEVDHRLRGREDEAAMLLTVHDELILEVRDNCAESVAEECRDCMEHALTLNVPTPVEHSIGASWADLK